MEPAYGCEGSIAGAAIETDGLTKDYGGGRGLFDQLLILDEPTSGLDPLNQQAFYQLVRETRERGATVFLSAHILSEVDHVCDRVGIIRAGKLVRVASLEELHHLRFHQVEIEFDEEPPIDRLHGIAGVELTEVQGRRVRLTVRGSFEPLMSVLAGHGIASLVSHEPSLEEAFLAYYGGSALEMAAQ
jgi:ABC-2 type transport system ATP-binding protein